MNLTVFFDLADPSKRFKEDIKEVLRLIGRYTEYFDVILGLNENEALKVYAALNDTELFENICLEKIGAYIFENMNIGELVIHPVDCCITVNKGGVKKQKGKVIENPKITTGGGDNFNAGYCIGRRLGMDIDDCMILAMAVSALYVKNGNSPSFYELIEYLNYK